MAAIHRGRAAKFPAALRVFYWGNVHALAQYTDGDALAVARSKDEAIKLIVGSGSTLRDSLETELRSTEPLVYDSPVGFAFWGSG